MVFLSVLTIALVGLARLTEAITNSAWASRSIYQVMTDRFALTNGSTDDCADIFNYCGGTWNGIVKQLDYIQGMGFTAIYISPVEKNIENNTAYGEAFHGYWPVDKYAVNEHFGTADDLKNLAQELHNRGMYLMVDVVINDMAQAIKGDMWDNPAPVIDWAAFNPFNDQKYFHPYCNITDWNNATDYQDCWFGAEVVALPDVDTESPDVVSMYQTWVKELVANYSIDGLRIDAAKHVDTAFLSPFSEAAGVFTLGEVYSGVVNDVCSYQKLIPGLPNYPVYFPIIQAFTAGNMLGLAQEVQEVAAGCPDTSLLATFSENHDLERFASYTPDMALAMNTLAFTILADGIPMVYQGQEQHMSGNYSPYNREALWPTKYNTNAPLYNLTATLNFIRNHAIGIDSRYISNHSVQLYVDNSTYVTSKGPSGVNIVSVFSNQGEHGGVYDLEVPKAFTAGMEVIEILSCNKTTANSAGNITVPMGAGLPRVYFPSFQLNGSGICGTAKNGQTNSTTNNTSSTNSTSSTKKHSGADTLQRPVPTLAMCIAFAFAFWLL